MFDDFRGITIDLEGITGHLTRTRFRARPVQRHHGITAELKRTRSLLLKQAAGFAWHGWFNRGGLLTPS